MNLLLRRARACACAGLGLLLAGAPAAAQPNAAQPNAAQPAPGQNWPGHGGSPYETNFSPLAAIDAGNVKQLGLAWSLDLPGEISLEATPLAIDGTLYFTGSYGTVYAVDAKTGHKIWTYDPQVWKHDPAKMAYSFAVNRGPAYADGRVFSATLDGRLIALDARSGHELWSVQTVAKDSPQTITGAPRAFRGKIIIGNAGADFGARGYVTAYDQKTGKQIWRFYVTPGAPDQNKGDPAMQRAAKTWTGDYWKTGTGGAVWDSISFDPDLDRIYLGTGNAGPQDPAERSPGGGDNLYTAAIVALNADTGKFIWDYQEVPRDAWDYDTTQQMALADLTIDGKDRKVLMQAPKNGFFYVIDRATGQLLSAEKIAKATWASRIDLKTGRPVENPGQRYKQGTVDIWPSATGAHSWQAMSFNPDTGLVYIPVMHEGMRMHHGPASSHEVEIAGIAIGTIPPPDGEPKGTLLAWNPVTQKPAWEVPRATLWNGGVLSTAGDLVFQGTADGFLSAYDARTGAKLWAFYAGLGIISPPIAYAVDGAEYVSVLVGYGGSAAIDSADMNAGWSFNAPRRLLTFKLGGEAKLPPSPPRFAKIVPLTDPGQKLDPAKIAAGRAAFLSCALCHGRNAVGAGGPAPDLRASALALDPNSLWTVLHDGALLSAGMPAFPQMTHAQMMDIWSYIRAQARATP